jgi:phosphoglycerate dehydrogenase-like enzyme
LIPVFAGPAPVSAELTQAICVGGGEIVDLALAEVLIWEDHTGEGLQDALQAAPRLKWVQLASAGVDWLFERSIYTGDYIWTCAKGDVFAESVAEMALLLLLSGFREMRQYVGATSWLPIAGRPLAGSRICIIGAGGVGNALIELLRPFNLTITVVRRTPGHVPGASAVFEQSRMLDALKDADATVLAVPLTNTTRHMIDRHALEAMPRGSWLVNVARGGLVDTVSLLAALDSGHLGGAALDVTDPEPLPAGHPLWVHPRVIITPHVANIDDLSREAFADRVLQNLRRWARQEPLVGQVDAHAGY